MLILLAAGAFMQEKDRYFNSKDYSVSWNAQNYYPLYDMDTGTVSCGGEKA